MRDLRKKSWWTILIVLGVVAMSLQAAFAVAEARENQWIFDKEKAGTIPDGWQAGETNSKGNPGKWEISKDKSAPSAPHVIALNRTRNSGGTYNLLIAEKTSYKDFELELKVKAIAGREDQGGGPIWRAKDENNYYVARWNPLENNLRVYYAKNGRRIQIASANVRLNPKEWHRIKIRHVGNTITVQIDEKQRIEVVDETFAESGMLGLWTKADAETAFDDINVKAIQAGQRDHQ